ncbi:Ig-like domain-containing protein [Paenibacillus pinistramenti]|uniref:Ig-like domain-containing protein n=1 Tax=Paenibacillus pinistramenti TaxID=1768003 RepID=UPI00110915A5|nr:Ig-like domain-containing protein [Paenibacillus pinistramenti]
MMRKYSIILVVLLLFNVLGSMSYAAAGTTFTYQSTTPASGSKGVAVTTKTLTMVFDRSVKTNSGYIAVKAEGADAEYTRINVSAVGSYSTKMDITLPSGTNLDYAAKYHVTGPEGVFVDESGSSSAAFDWTFTTISENSTAPTATLAQPAVSGTSASLSMEFNQMVSKGTGNIYIKKASTNEAAATYAVTDSSKVVLSGRTVTFSVSGLTKGERYYVLIDKGAFLNGDELPYAGISSAQTWYFNIVGTPGQISSTTPGTTQSEAVTSTIQLKFSRPVYPDSGTISVKLADGTEASSVAVTSSSVTGGGTNTISIALPSSLLASTSYSVTVPAGTFKDTDDNAVPSTAHAWSFKTAASATSTLKLSSLSPTDGETSVSLSEVPTATFNTAIKSSSGSTSFSNGSNGITLRKSGTTTIPSATVTISGTKLIITPSKSLDAGSTYYVDITSGALLNASTNASYSGLSGASSWSFTTVTSDSTAPVLQSAAMYSNSVIRLLYNETLNSSINLLTSSFAVTVNGQSRTISDAYISGSSVYIVLETGVAVGQVVKLSYTNSGVRTIQDTSGNLAISLSGRAVTNDLESSLEKPVEGYVSEDVVTLEFQEDLDDVSTYAYKQFTVKANSSSMSIESIGQSGNIITLYLKNSVSDGAVVKVSYTPGSYPLKDESGQKISAFTDFYIQNVNDDTAPVFKTAVGSDNDIILTYNEALSTTSVPLISQYSVLVGSTPDYVTAVSIVDNQVKLTLASSFTSAQTVTVSYVSSSDGVADLNGNVAASLDLQPVTYNVVVDGVSSAYINGSTLSIQFSGSLTYSSSTISTRLFYVMVDGVSAEISSATVSGSVVTLTLTVPVTSGQVVDVSFMPGSSPPLYTSSGSAVQAFSRMTVQNLTAASTDSSAAGLPSNMTRLAATEFGPAGYVMDTTFASAATTSSRAGQSVSEYLIDSSKMQTAYNYVASAAASSESLLVFEVPSTQNAAYVGIPLKTLMEAYTRMSTLSFGVRYGDALYVLPLSEFPFTNLSQTQASSFSTSYLWIQLERVAKDKLNVITSTNGVTALPIVNPVEVFDSIGSASAASQATIALTGDLYIRTSGTVTADQTAMARFDRTAQTISFLPTNIDSAGSYTVVSTTLDTGSLIAGPTMGSASYSDIGNHWAKAAITELADKLIVNARSGGMFMPKENITRAEFATFIVKGLGLVPDKTSAAQFSDVSSSSAAAGYIGAAAKAGIVNGVTASTFKPGSYITREQMALMMVRALNSAGREITVNGTAAQLLSKFKDYKSIADQSTVAQAVAAGIIQGTSAGTFNPKGTATRAEAAVMLKRVLDNLGYLD